MGRGPAQRLRRRQLVFAGRQPSKLAHQQRLVCGCGFSLQLGDAQAFAAVSGSALRRR
jgi:hypothetical protein